MQTAEPSPGNDAAPIVLHVDVGDGALHTLVAGTGPEMVMLHGWTLDHRSWAPQAPLAAHSRLIRPDRRGFGRSSAPADLTGEWQDIDHLVGAAPFILVGLSQGASVALDYARRRPERVRALVLVGTPLPGLVPHEGIEQPIPRDHYAALVQSGQLAAMKADWSANPLVRTTPAAAHLLAPMLNDYDGRDLRAGLAKIAINADDIAALPMPVLAIAGVDDTEWRRQVATFIGTTAPKGQAVAIEDAGHLCNLDNPDRFNAVLATFFSSLLLQ